MKKINFVNNSEPYLSAENFNQMQDNIEEEMKSKYIVATTNSSNLAGNNNFVPLNVISDNVGNKFRIENNKVIIGQGVTKIRVSGSIFIEDADKNGYLWGQITKNQISVSGTITPYANVGYYLSAPISPTIIQVVENDAIELFVDNTCGGKLRTGLNNTWLLVEVVE